MAQNFGFGRGRPPPGAQEIQNNPSYAVPVDREWSKLHDQIKRYRNYVKLRIEEIKNKGTVRGQSDLEDLECWLCAIDNPRDYCTSDLNSIYDRLQEDSRHNTIPGAFDQRDREEENPAIESTPEPGHGLVTDFGYIPPSFSVTSFTSQFEDRAVENNSEQTNETSSQNCTSSTDKFRTNFSYKPDLPKLLKVKPVKTSPSSSTDSALYHRSPEEIVIQDDDSDTPVVYDYNHVMTDCNQIQEISTPYKPRNNIHLQVGRDIQTPNPAPIINQDVISSHRRLSVESMGEKASVNQTQPIPRSSYSEVGVGKARAHRQPSCESLFTRRMPDPSAPRNDRRQKSRDKLCSRRGSKDDRRTRSSSRSESSDKGTQDEGRFNRRRISHDVRRSRSRSRGRKRRRNSRDDYRCFSRSKERNRRRDSREKNRSRSRSRERNRRRNSRDKNRSRSLSRERNRRKNSRDENHSRSRSRERNRRRDSRDEHRSRSRSRVRSRSRESRSNASVKYDQRPRTRDESDNTNGSDFQIQVGDKDRNTTTSTESKSENKRKEKQTLANPQELIVPLLAKEIATLLQRGLCLNTSSPTLTQPTFQQSVNSSCQSVPGQPGVGYLPRPLSHGEIPTASFNGVYPNVPFNPPIPQYAQPPQQSYSNNPQGQVFLSQNSSNIVYGTQPSVYVQQQRQRFPPHPTHGGNPYDFNNGISQAHVNQQHVFNGSFQNPRQNQVRMNNFLHNQALPRGVRPGPITPDRFPNSSRNQNPSIPFQPMPPPSATLTSQDNVQGPQINHPPHIQMPAQVPRIVAPTYKDHRELHGIPSPRPPRHSNPRPYNNPRDPRKGPAQRNAGNLSRPTPINSLPTPELSPEVQTSSTPTDKIMQPNIPSPTSIINQILEKLTVNVSVPSALIKKPSQPLPDLTDLLSRNKSKPRAIRTPASKRPVAECQPHEREQGRRVSTEEIASKSTTGSGLASKIRADSGITDPSPPIHTPSSLGVPRQNSGTPISAVSTVSSQQKTELDRRRQRIAEQCRNDPVPKQPSRFDKIMKDCINAGIGNSRSSTTKNPKANKPNLNSESPIVTRQFAVKSSSKKRNIAARANLALSQPICPKPTSNRRPANTQEATVRLTPEPQPTHNEIGNESSDSEDEEVIGIQKRKKVLPLAESESENELEPETVPVQLIPENKRFCKDGFIAGDKNIKVLVHQLPEFYTTKTDFSFFRFFENQFKLICRARLKETRRTSQTKKAYSEAELQRIRQEKSQQPYQNLRSKKKKATQANSNLQTSTSKSTQMDRQGDSVPSISPNSEPPVPDVEATPSNLKPNRVDQELVVPLSSSNSKQAGVEPNPSTSGSGLSREEFVQRFVSLRFPDVRVKEEKIDPNDQ